MIRYQALDRCFRNKARRFYIEDLVEACNEALYEYEGKGSSVKKRQIYEDINFMMSLEGYNAPIDKIKDGRRTYYRYGTDFSINKRPLSDEEMDMLTQAIEVLNRFKGMPQFDWMETLLTNLQDKFGLRGNKEPIIGFEQNVDYLAAKHLSGLFSAVVNKQVLHVTYKTFAGIVKEWMLHPYYIKEFNNRWFLFGMNNDKDGQITNVPLDRIENFEVVNIPYKENADIDFKEYFDDVVGVTIPNKPVESVRLQFAPERFPYILSKPLHGSMRVLDREHGIVELSVIPNKELETLIWSFGDQVEVLAPEWLRARMKERIEALAKKYQTNAH